MKPKLPIGCYWCSAPVPVSPIDGREGFQVCGGRTVRAKSRCRALLRRPNLLRICGEQAAEMIYRRGLMRAYAPMLRKQFERPSILLEML